MEPKRERLSGTTAGGGQVTDDTVLKITKEIAVKFIEVGRLTPATFDETFKAIHRTVAESVADHE